jgi:methionyl-tRNA formyltransferase
MRIVMMGTGTFAEPTFEALLAAGENVVGLITQPERDAGQKRGSTRQTGKGMANLAREAGIPVAQPENINTPEGITQLQAFAPDLAVVAAYGQILKPEVIAVPTRGMINVHASLLPKYRGAAPVAHAILNGETQTGVTIIRITPGLDSGDMLAKASLDIRPDETAGELEARLAPLGAKLALEVVHRMKAGPIVGEKQDSNIAKKFKAPKIKKEDGLIDWSKPAESICRHIRAMQPWPTAYTFFHRPGKEPMRVIVNRAQVVASFATDITYPSPGQIHTFIRVMPSGGPLIELVSGLVVWAGHGTVMAITELQPAGKKRMTADEFLRGYPVQEGYRFGPERLP